MPSGTPSLAGRFQRAVLATPLAITCSIYLPSGKGYYGEVFLVDRAYLAFYHRRHRLWRRWYAVSGSDKSACGVNCHARRDSRVCGNCHARRDSRVRGNSGARSDSRARGNSGARSDSRARGNSRTRSDRRARRDTHCHRCSPG